MPASMSPHLIVQSTVQPYINNTNSMNQYSGVVAGQMRFNMAMQQVEVFDGTMWQNITTTATVGLNMAADEAIAWAIKKMGEERELSARLERYPALKEAHDKFKVIEALVQGEEEKKA